MFKKEDFTGIFGCEKLEGTICESFNVALKTGKMPQFPNRYSCTCKDGSCTWYEGQIRLRLITSGLMSRLSNLLGK